MVMNPADNDKVDIPSPTQTTNAAAIPPGLVGDDSRPPPLGDRSERLVEAYRRYDIAYRSSRPGTPSALALARARLDLSLLLEAEAPEGQLPEVVQVQLERDAQTLLSATPELGL